MASIANTSDLSPFACNGNGHLPSARLRLVLDAAVIETGLSMKDLTVLAVQNDPYRVYGDAGLRDGQWFADQVVALNRVGRPLHLRGFHYAILSRQATKPNGLPYTNTDKDWTWLQEKAADAARWLGLVPFEQIIDVRNKDAATVIRFKQPTPQAHIDVGGVEVSIPGDLTPTVDVAGFEGVQPFKLVLIGEKSSLKPVLSPIARQHQADLYLPTGEISDTLLYQIAEVGAEDGRPMRVFYFSDCDPSGWQMPLSTARKLQALIDLEFEGLDVEVRRVGLTPDQVRDYGLPSTPLKDTERRADRWQAAMGVAQTEIDALAELQPNLLRRMATDALRPFFDDDLAGRVADARQAWLDEAQGLLDAALGPEELERIRLEAEERLAELQAQVDELNRALHVDLGWVDLPDMQIPTPTEAMGVDGKPLFSSAWSYAEASRRLIESKAYQLDGEGRE